MYVRFRMCKNVNPLLEARAQFHKHQIDVAHNYRQAGCPSRYAFQGIGTCETLWQRDQLTQQIVPCPRLLSNLPEAALLKTAGTLESRASTRFSWKELHSLRLYVKEFLEHHRKSESFAVGTIPPYVRPKT